MAFMTKSFVIGSLAVLGAASAAPALAQQQLTATGSSFPAPMFQQWFEELKQNDGPVVDYTAVNSVDGIRQLIDLEVDFGATDRPIAPTTADKVKRGLIQIPVVGGAVAVGYNKKDCDLKLTQTQLTKVFLGEISDWKQLGCNEGPIKVITRSDASGTTLAFTKSLSSWDKSFNEKIGSGMLVSWPIGTASESTEGVTESLRTTKGSLGYVNVPSIKGVIKAASIENKSGNFMQPNSATGIAAIESIREAGLTPESINNPPGRDAYPIVAMSWLQAFETGNGEEAEAIRKTFKFMLSDPAQSQADNLGYVPLPEMLQEAALADVENIKN